MGATCSAQEDLMETSTATNNDMHLYTGDDAFHDFFKPPYWNDAASSVAMNELGEIAAKYQNMTLDEISFIVLYQYVVKCATPELFIASFSDDAQLKGQSHRTHGAVDQIIASIESRVARDVCLMVLWAVTLNT